MASSTGASEIERSLGSPGADRHGVLPVSRSTQNMTGPMLFAEGGGVFESARLLKVRRSLAVPMQ